MKQLLHILLSFSLLSPSAWAQDLVVHEWGTFTSFMGSNGQLQEGLHHEDEPLPDFVYGVRNLQNRLTPPDFGDDCRNFKMPCGALDRFSENRTDFTLAGTFSESLPQQPINAGITQKMETPVVYFYGKAGQQVNVNVKFPKGIISQYYPRATYHSPKLDRVSTLGPSNFDFNVTLLEKGNPLRMPYAPPTSIYSHARNVNSNGIKIGNDEAKLIFYRGVGDFKTNFKVRSLKAKAMDGLQTPKLELSNLSDQRVNNAILLNSDGKKGIVMHLGGVDQRLTTKVPSLDHPKAKPFAEYVKEAKGVLVKSLRNEGLYKDEAEALANTWENSYFNTPGVRILYTVPTIETERILPMKVSPQPKELVRVLVGRIEVMTADQEEAYLDLLSNFEASIDVEREFGRFYEPKLRRLLQLVKATDYPDAEHKQKLQDRIGLLLL